MIFIHIVSVCSLVIAHAPLVIFYCQVYFNIFSYFKLVGNSNGGQQANPTSPLMKEIPSSVISVANNHIESSMKESSTKTAFYKHTQRRDSYLYTYYFMIQNHCQKTMGFGISYRNLVGVGPLTLCWMFLVSYLSTNADIATKLCLTPQFNNQPIMLYISTI